MPMNHSQSWVSHQPKLSSARPVRLRPQIIGDREIHDHDGAAEDQVEVACDPLRIVDAGVQLIAHVDQPAGAAEAEHDQRQRGRQHDRILPGNALTHPNAPRPPRSRLAISADAQMVKTVSSVGSATSR